ncbi:MAG: UDP-N-acetylmuramoyl-L-alanine--D-glutamate ligase, partial [Clostridiales Family XIII bacterium]|nr:UDP-N-acetylmuramoyl-L-alanine--D-glutamate ligase [Clostridiales Family XIII bacterium]
LDIERYFNGAEPEDVYELIVISPGVSPELDFIQRTVNAGGTIIGELELAYELSPSHWIAITGTNGKTTTTSLVGEIFKASGRHTSVLGNIGEPAVKHVSKLHEDDYIIAEVSSFQLESSLSFKPEIAAVLNVTPDHMDRHHTMSQYTAEKAKITANQIQNDFFIFNEDEGNACSIAAHTGARTIGFSVTQKLHVGAYLDQEKEELLLADLTGEIHPLVSLSELKMKGMHNVENVLAAAAIAYFSNIDLGVIRETLKTFKGVAHRLEHVILIDGVDYYNDSKGTNPDASMKAVEALSDNIILIAGGYDKKSDFTTFAQFLHGRVKALILLGATADQLEAAARAAGITEIYRCEEMGECVRQAYELAVSGDKVLLSPACASWDMYDNFESRGDHFKSLVQDLAEKNR